MTNLAGRIEELEAAADLRLQTNETLNAEIERLRKAIEGARELMANARHDVADRILAAALTTPSPELLPGKLAVSIQVDTPSPAASEESGLIRSLPSVVMTVEAYNQMESKAHRLDSINELMRGGNALLIHPGKNLVTYTIIAGDQMPKVLEALAEPIPTVSIPEPQETSDEVDRRTDRRN